MSGYVHGYSPREAERLHDQASTLRELLHHDTGYPAGARVLEAGCGVGATTQILAERSPGAHITSVDAAPDSLRQAKAELAAQGLANVRLGRADLYALPFADETFAHVFGSFVLEHLARPADALAELRRVLRTGGTLTAVEGDHGSCYVHPETEAGRRVWACLIQVQATLGGDSLIGRRLYPLLQGAGLREVRVSPRMVYCDATRPRMMDGFVKKTIIPMVEGVRAQALAWGLADESGWAEGIRDLHRTGTPPDGTFCYTFFKGVAVK
jgi:ubiquinone/menaquinone biosynthesis C-methylase UbiE